MSRARNLGNLGNENLITGDANTSRIGIGSTTPVTSLDVVGVVTATDGFHIGISSAGVSIASTVQTLNFVGSGNTVVDRGNGSIDISISGSGGGGGLGTAIDSDATGAASRIFTTTRNDIISAGTSVTIDASGGGGGMAFTKLNGIVVGTGATFHIGSGTTLIMDVLNIF